MLAWILLVAVASRDRTSTVARRLSYSLSELQRKISIEQDRHLLNEAMLTAEGSQLTREPAERTASRNGGPENLDSLTKDQAPAWLLIQSVFNTRHILLFLRGGSCRFPGRFPRRFSCGLPRGLLCSLLFCCHFVFLSIVMELVLLSNEPGN